MRKVVINHVLNGENPIRDEKDCGFYVIRRGGLAKRTGIDVDQKPKNHGEQTVVVHGEIREPAMTVYGFRIPVIFFFIVG